MRVALLGGFAFVLFAIVFFRLWFLQVLTGEDYVSQARDNRVRKVRIEAPRGDIVDRNGRKLVETQVAPVVQICRLAAQVGARRGRHLPARAEAENARLAAEDQLRRSSATCARPAAHVAQPAPQRHGSQAAAVASRPVPPSRLRGELGSLYGASAA